MTWDGQFRDPTMPVGDRFGCEDAQGKVLVVRPIQYIESMMTKMRDQPTDAIKVDVVNLNAAPGEQEWYQATLWFGGRLVGLFKRHIGQPFVGYVQKERTPQGFMAWNFVSMAEDPAATQAAQAWVARHPEFVAPVEEHPGYEQPRNAHHEVGPPPEWAGAVPARPGAPRAAPGPAPGYTQGPAAPSLPSRPPAGPPAVGQPQVSAPPASGPPAVGPPTVTVPAPLTGPGLIGAQESVMDRLRRQRDTPATQEVTQAEAGY